MSDTSTGNGKVVVNRSMSLDGFIAGPGHAMDWIFDFVAPDEFPEIAAATGPGGTPGLRLLSGEERDATPAHPAARRVYCAFSYFDLKRGSC
jgi:hypothetical protein